MVLVLVLVLEASPAGVTGMDADIESAVTGAEEARVMVGAGKCMIV